MCWWELIYVCRKGSLVCCHLNVANNPLKQRFTQKIIGKRQGKYSLRSENVFCLLFLLYLRQKGVNSYIYLLEKLS